MARMLLKRLLFAVFALFVVSLAVFAATQALRSPGLRAGTPNPGGGEEGAGCSFGRISSYYRRDGNCPGVRVPVGSARGKTPPC